MSERCGNCGEGVARPVWAVYADEGFAGKQLDPMPLHPKCFKANERITASRWERPDDGDDLELVEFEMTRYRKVEAPHG